METECIHEWNLFRVKKYTGEPTVVIAICKKCLQKREISLVDEAVIKEKLKA